MSMNVIAVGYDKKMFDRGSVEFARMQQCAAAVDALDIIIFTRSSEPYVTMPVTSTFTIHATASRFRVFSLLKAIRLGWRIAKSRQKIAVVTAQDPFETALVSWCIARPLQAVFNVQIHSDVFASPAWLRETPLNYLRAMFGKFFIHRADVIRVVSNRSKKTIETTVGVGKKDIRLLPVSVSLPTNLPLVDRLRDSSTFTLVTAGRLSVEKNLQLLLRAFARVHVNHPHLRLRIIGTGKEEVALKALALKLFGIIDAPVTFEGWTNNLYAELAKADAYVLTSNYEGWARVLIEALAVGLPIVTTDVGCVGEVVLPDVHGLVVPVGDEDALVTALTRLVNEKVLYEQFRATIAAIDTSTLVGARIDDYGERWRQSLL